MTVVARPAPPRGWLAVLALLLAPCGALAQGTPYWTRTQAAPPGAGSHDPRQPPAAPQRAPAPSVSLVPAPPPPGAMAPPPPGAPPGPDVQPTGIFARPSQQGPAGTTASGSRPPGGIGPGGAPPAGTSPLTERATGIFAPGGWLPTSRSPTGPGQDVQPPPAPMMPGRS